MTYSQKCHNNNNSASRTESVDGGVPSKTITSRLFGALLVVDQFRPDIQTFIQTKRNPQVDDQLKVEQHTGTEGGRILPQKKFNLVGTRFSSGLTLNRKKEQFMARRRETPNDEKRPTTANQVGNVRVRNVGRIESKQSN